MKTSFAPDGPVYKLKHGLGQQILLEPCHTFARPPTTRPWGSRTDFCSLLVRPYVHVGTRERMSSAGTYLGLRTRVFVCLDVHFCDPPPLSPPSFPTPCLSWFYGNYPGKAFRVFMGTRTHVGMMSIIRLDMTTDLPGLFFVAERKPRSATHSATENKPDRIPCVYTRDAKS